MSDLIEFKGGDTIKQKVIIKKKSTGAPENIPTSTVVEAFVIEPKRRKVLISAVPVVHTDLNNDWPNGVLYFEFDNENTPILNQYDQQEVFLALRLTKDSEPTTLTRPVKAVRMPLNTP